MMGGKDDDEKQNGGYKCKTCNMEECFVKNSRGASQKCSTKLIGCDLCKNWYHGTCQELTIQELTFIGKMDNKGVKWFCDMCVIEINSATGKNEPGNLAALAENTATTNKLNNIETMVSKLMTTVDSTREGLTERIEKLEISYAAAVQSNTEGVKRSIEINSSAKHLLAKNFEQNQAESRKYNAILYGIKAEENKSALEQVTEMLQNECFMHTKEPIKAVRLQSTAANKPIKLEFTDENTKWEFMKRVHATQRGNNIWCKLDESKEVRERQYELRQHIKQKKAEDPSSNTQYRIRNMKIQSKEESGEWRDLNTTEQVPKTVLTRHSTL